MKTQSSVRWRVFFFSCGKEIKNLEIFSPKWRVKIAVSRCDGIQRSRNVKHNNCRQTALAAFSTSDLSPQFVKNGNRDGTSSAQSHDAAGVQQQKLNAREQARGHRRQGDDGDGGEVKPMHMSDSDGKVSGPS